MASIFFQQYLDQKLTTILCETLSEIDRQNGLAAPEFVSPSRTKQFWQALKAIVDKIRLRHTADNLVTTLKNVSVFGEVTLCVWYVCAGETLKVIAFVRLFLPPPATLQTLLGLTSTNKLVFGSTIAENITIAHPQASFEEIRPIGTTGGSRRIYSASTNGMGCETQISEEGGMFWSGQLPRQFAIARALSRLFFHPSFIALPCQTHLEIHHQRLPARIWMSIKLIIMMPNLLN